MANFRIKNCWKNISKGRKKLTERKKIKKTRQRETEREIEWWFRRNFEKTGQLQKKRGRKSEKERKWRIVYLILLGIYAQNIISSKKAKGIPK